MAVRSRTFLLLLAIASGLAAAVLAVRYLRTQASPILEARPASTGKALVAARDLAIGTRIAEQDVRLVDWPGDAVPAGLLSDPTTVIGRGVVSQLRLNEPLLETKLAPTNGGVGLPTLIPEGMRALALQVDEVSNIAGFVTPGSHVDVLLTMANPADDKKEPVTRSILQNIPTLASGQTIQRDPEGKPVPVSVVTVLVTPAQAETLALATGQGRIHMALRNMLDTLEVETPGARQSTLLFAERKPLGPARRSAPRTQSPPVSTERETIVEGFEGGNRTIRRFSTP